MAPGYGIKVSRPGYDVQTASPQELAFSSAYETLKIHAQGNGSLTHTSRTATIAHNLGYVPFFLVHSQLDPAVASASLVGNNADYFISPFRLGTAIDIYEAENTHDIIAWADTTNLYVKARSNVGVEIYPPSNQFNLSECLAYEYTGGTGGNGTSEAWIGHDPTLENQYGAVRFDNIAITQGSSVYNAQFNFYVDSRDGTGQVSMTVWGIDEDDTAVFNSGTIATARTKTTASLNSNSTLSVGNTLGLNVTSIVDEIVGRGGWSSGNALGIMMWNNGTTGDNAYFNSTWSSTLEIIKTASLASFKYTIFLNQLE